jgi:predicted  nucleic acid-binding Zn-ribbon protein
VSDLENEKRALSGQIEELQKSLSAVRSELMSSSRLFQNSKAQINMLNKEKGVAMRDNAASYEHSIQMETQVGGGSHV